MDFHILTVQVPVTMDGKFSIKSARRTAASVAGP
jgi:hypothetical protein